VRGRGGGGLPTSASPPRAAHVAVATGAVDMHPGPARGEQPEAVVTAAIQEKYPDHIIRQLPPPPPRPAVAPAAAAPAAARESQAVVATHLGRTVRAILFPEEAAAKRVWKGIHPADGGGWVGRFSHGGRDYVTSVHESQWGAAVERQWMIAHLPAPPGACRWRVVGAVHATPQQPPPPPPRRRV
jgi:hypothetical protein